MKSTTRAQYELACRVDRLWAHKRIDDRTARVLFDSMPVRVAYSAMRSAPAPVPTWRSCDRWLRFLDIKQQLPTTPRLVAPRHSSWF
jgi:hypothetical protein